MSEERTPKGKLNIRVGERLHAEAIRQGINMAQTVRECLAMKLGISDLVRNEDALLQAQKDLKEQENMVYMGLSNKESLEKARNKLKELEEKIKKSDKNDV